MLAEELLWTEREPFLGGAAGEEILRQVRPVVRRVSIRNQRTRWGSCGRDGVICLNWRLVLMPAARNRATSAASACASRIASRTCAASPAPPLAITGTGTASATARVSARSYPVRAPSRSMLVSRISPAPRSAPSRAHSMASRPVGVRPPATWTSQLSPVRLAWALWAKVSLPVRARIVARSAAGESTLVCEIDLRPGGKFRTVMQGPAGEVVDNSGCYLEVVPGRRLVFTDALGPGWFRLGDSDLSTKDTLQIGWFALNP